MESSRICHVKTWVYLEEMVCISFLETSLLLWNSRNWNKIPRGWEVGVGGAGVRGFFSKQLEPTSQEVPNWLSLPCVSGTVSDAVEDSGKFKHGLCLQTLTIYWDLEFTERKLKLQLQVVCHQGSVDHRYNRSSEETDAFRVVWAEKMSRKRWNKK